MLIHQHSSYRQAHRLHVAVWEGFDDLKPLRRRLQVDPGEHRADRLDLLIGERGQIRQRALAYLLALAVRLAQQVASVPAWLYHPEKASCGPWR